MREKLKQLLPSRASVAPAYPTQDEVYSDNQSSSDEETTSSEILKFNDLRIGDIVEVYWEGEHEWFEGEIKDVDSDDEQFEVCYKSDDQTLWHNHVDYPVRATY